MVSTSERARARGEAGGQRVRVKVRGHICKPMHVCTGGDAGRAAEGRERRGGSGGDICKPQDMYTPEVRWQR